jgi:hypothetical protein
MHAVTTTRKPLAVCAHTLVFFAFLLMKASMSRGGGQAALPWSGWPHLAQKSA